jgi:hypothetical protein
LAKVDFSVYFVYSVVKNTGFSLLANSPLVGQIAKATNGVQRMTTANTYDDLNRLTGIPRLSGPQSLSLVAGDGRSRLSDITAPPSGACPLKYDITIN